MPTPAGFSDLLEGLTDSAYGGTRGYDLLQQKFILQQKEKGPGVKSGGSQEQASKDPLPVGSHRMCLIPPALSCDNVNQGSLLESLCQGCGKKTGV